MLEINNPLERSRSIDHKMNLLEDLLVNKDFKSCKRNKILGIRQLQVFTRLVLGYSLDEIAQDLNLTKKTVVGYRRMALLRLKYRLC